MTEGISKESVEYIEGEICKVEVLSNIGKISTLGHVLKAQTVSNIAQAAITALLQTGEVVVRDKINQVEGGEGK